MKIVCQSCGRKYSIADDKVVGKKVFKIKCKNCGEDILVRGGEAGAEGADATGPAEQFSEDEATRVVGGADSDAVWHAVVGGSQQGPYSIPQLRDLMASSQMDMETYVWKDGFADWKPLREVPELASQIGAGAGAAAMTPDATVSSPAGAGDLFGGPSPAASSGGGLFGEPAKPIASAGTAPGAKARAGSKAAGGGDLFGDAQAQASKPLFGGDEEDVSTSANAGGSPRVNTAAQMTGQRNENSVLFSLATLQQVAGTGGPTSSAKVSEPGAAGKATNDQSGLIDIKSMASTFGPSSASSGSKQKALDEILTVGGGGGLASPLAAPVLAPVPTPSTMSSEPERPAGTNKTVVFAAIAVAAILAGGGIAVAFLMKNNAQPAPQMAMNNTPTTPAPTTGMGTAPMPMAPTPPAPTAPTPTTAGGTAPTTNGESGTAAGGSNAGGSNAAGGGNSGGGNGGGGGSHRGAHSSSGGGGGGSSGAGNGGGGGSSPVAAAAPTPAAGGGGGSSCGARCHGDIDCLLRCSTSNSAGGGGGAAAGGGGGAAHPESPSRTDVMSAMNGVRGSVGACSGPVTGMAPVAITFASSGRITTTNVGGPFQGTPQGSCIARAVRAATVPPFTRPTFTVNFPFSIR